MAELQRDFEELLRAFNRNKVEYSIVGAFAVGFHAVPRYTKDLDILVARTVANAKRILSALQEFGFGSLKLSVEDFTRPNFIIQLGFEPVRIDLLTTISGIDAQAWKRRVLGSFGAEKVYYIGFDDLLLAKKAAGRKQDLADIETLIATKKPKKKKSGAKKS